MIFNQMPLPNYEGRRDGGAAHIQAIIEAQTAPGFWVAVFPAGEEVLTNGLGKELTYDAMAERGECILRPATMGDLETIGARQVAAIERDLSRWGTTE